MPCRAVYPEVQSTLLREVKASRPSRRGLEPGGEELVVSEAEQEGQREAHPGGFLEEADSEPRWDLPKASPARSGQE